MDGAVKFNVSANTAQFDAAMSRVGSVAQTTGDRVRMAFSGLGSILAGGVIVSGIQNVLRAMDDISDRAKRFGVTVEEIQKVGNAADIVGTNFETVARAMDRTGVAANKATREGGSLAKAFARVNLDPAKFAAASLQERIEMIAEAQRAANGDAAKMAELFEVIGVRAAGINFAELSTEMGNVNAASAKTVEQLAKANDLLTKMKQNSTILAANLLRIAIFDPAEKIGSLLAGEGLGMTTEDVQEKYRRKAVRDDLAAKGRLISGEDGKPVEPARFTPNTEAGRKQQADAEENERRITAEIERQKNALKEAEKAQRALNSAESEYFENLQKSSAEIKNRTDAINNSSGTSGLSSLANPAKRNGFDYQDVRNQLDNVFLTEADKLRNIGRNTEEYRSKMEVLNRQYDEALQNVERAREFNRTKESAQPPAQVADTVKQAVAEELERQRSIDERRDEAKAGATETTLQKAVAYLQELTGKLPQPALV